MSPVSEPQKPLSEILLEVCDHEASHITVAELTEKFGGRALGALLMVFSLACLLPWPPGGTTIFGLPLLLLAPQLVIGQHKPWLPAAIKRRGISIADLRKGLPKVLPGLRRLEAVSRPRLALLFGPVGEAVIGLVITALALVLILPIWGGNILPAIASLLLSLSLVQRDGALALLGYAMVAASVGVLVLAFHIIVQMFQHALAALSAA
jgi:hypothetical protein